jgi:N-acetylmuramoyl-L-alanine amidase
VGYTLRVMLNPSNQYSNVDVYGVTEASRMRILAGLIQDKLYKSEYSKSIVCAITKADMSDNLHAVVDQEASFKPHIFLSLHLNGANGNATGTECWYYDGDAFGKRVAYKVSASVATLIGIVDRGSKATLNAPEGGMYVVDQTKGTSILLEACFQDRKGDMDKFLSTMDKVANQIAWTLIDECQKQYGQLAKDVVVTHPADNAAAMKYIAEIEKNVALLKQEVAKWQ